MQKILVHLIPLCTLIILATTAATPVLAQNVQGINPDRPDLTPNSYVVPTGYTMVELGLLYQKETTATSEARTYAYPTALVRYGLLDKLELRVLGALKDSVVENGEQRTFSGAGPLSVGARLKLLENQGWVPQASLTVMVALPVASRRFRPENPEPRVTLAFANELSDKSELQYGLTQGWVEGSSVTRYAVNFSTDLTDAITFLVEAVGEKERGEQAGYQGVAALQFGLGLHLMLDVAAGLGLNDAAPDYFVGTGLSVRLPK
ncbi:transporter [Pontibacter harenae]|uniref:transporter n=1 Tax=Pontibacter harenae TaxID=2894083 RepID=UPI001E645599|nr:transporter [Pontibacter harenae]MCC9169135.1 transporter [Pontibacter harenae]